MGHTQKNGEIIVFVGGLIILIYLCLSGLLATYSQLPLITPTVKAVISTPTPKPTNTATSTPTLKPTNTSTSTPTPKPTNTSTSTPIPKPTNTSPAQPTFISIISLALILIFGGITLIWAARIFLGRVDYKPFPIDERHIERFERIREWEVVPGILKELDSHRIRLDTAAPETVIVSQAFDLAAAIRELESPVIQEDGLSNIKKSQGLVYYQLNQKIVKYKVEVESPDCDIPVKSKTFLLQVGRDSEVQYFQFVPKREGKISIHINAYQIDEVDLIVANTRTQVTSIVESKATDEIKEQATREAVTRLLAIKTKIRIVLSEDFSYDDIAVICYDAGIDVENLKGDTKTAKVISLIQRFDHRGEINHLIKIIKAARPNALLD